MQITKTHILSNFAKGVDLKTDPWQVPLGSFLELVNSVFDKGGLLQKRNGFGVLAELPSTTYSYLTTFSGNLTALGPAVAALNSSNESWVTKGAIAPMSVSTLPLIRSSVGQTQADAVVAANGLVCTVYTENASGTVSYLYAVADSVTGQNIVAPTAIPVASGAVSGAPRVFLLGNFFVVVFTNLISSVSHLQYVVISTLNPTSISPNLDLAASYVPSAGLSWDGTVAAGNLYLAYNTTAGGQAVQVTYLSAAAAASAFAASPAGPAAPTTFLGYTASLMSVCADTTGATPIVYVNFFAPGPKYAFTAVLDNTLGVVLAPVQCITIGGLTNLASAAQNGSCSIFAEYAKNYDYDSDIPSHYLFRVTVTPTGTTFRSVFSSGAGTITASSAAGLVNGMSLVDNTTLGNIAANTTFTVSGATLTLSANTLGNSASSPGDAMAAATVTNTTGSAVVIRSVGLASKAFIIDGTIYFLAAYESPFQPTYFLVNGSTSSAAAPAVTAKLAYSNGGGYITGGLPSVTVTDGAAQLAYLFKDLIEAQAPAAAQTIGIRAPAVYTQTGINLGTFLLGGGIDTAETGSNLHLSGGFLWMYDGYLPVEHGFFVWPDSLEASISTASLTPVGDVEDDSAVITNVSFTLGLGIGMAITGTGIPADTTVLSFTTDTITLSNPATATNSAVTLTLEGNIGPQPNGSTNTDAYYYRAIYEWTDNQGNIHRSAPSVPLPITTVGSGETGTYIFSVSLPTLRLTYKVANKLKIRLYRWSVANPVYYEVTSITFPTLNSTTVDYVTIVDALNDTAIIGNNILYTTGGVIENVGAPATNLMTLFDTRLWMVDAEDPNLLWFSKQVIEATPVEMSDLLTYFVPPSTAAQGPTGPVRALAPMDDKLILFKENAIYYVNGMGPDNTGTNNQYSQPIFVTAVVGCTNQQSIVFTPAGLMFQSSKGIWLLGRDLSTSYIGSPVEDFNSSTVQSAVNVPHTNQVRFTLDTGEQLMYDYFYGQWGTFKGASAISSCIFQGLHTVINKYGQALQETPGLYLDGQEPVLLGFKTAWAQLAALQGFQRFYYFYFLGQYLSPHLLNVEVAYNFVPSTVHSTLIRPTNFSASAASPYGEQPSPYGSPTALEQWKIHAKIQKCQSFQIKCTEVFDPSYGVPPGAGLTLSGLSMCVAVKKGVRPIRGANTAG